MFKLSSPAHNSTSKILYSLEFVQIRLGGVEKEQSNSLLKTNAFMIIIKAFLSKTCLT